MTFDEFEQLVTNITNGEFVIREKLPLDEQPTPRSRRMKEYTKELKVTWVTGGMRGGSCWGGELKPMEDWEKDKEPEFEALDKILEEICPNITFMQYKRICQSVIEEDSEYYPDYYGNSTEYGVKKVKLENLYKELNARGLLPDEPKSGFSI